MGVIRQRDIRGFHASYHRNGMMGESYYLCSFSMRDGKHWVDLRAVLFDAAKHCAVFSGNCAQHWGGDEYEGALREAIRLQNENQPLRAFDRIDHRDGRA